MVKVIHRGMVKDATVLDDGVYTIGSLKVSPSEIVVVDGPTDLDKWSFLAPPPGAKIRITDAKEAENVEIESIDFDSSILKAFGYSGLYRHQAESLTAAANDDVLLAFNVSAGKSFVALCKAIEDALETDGQTLYICPTNALADNQFHDSLKVFEKLGITSTIIRGGVPAEERNPSADVIFTNFYALDHLLNKSNFSVCNVGTVILDELHMLAAGAPGGHLRGVLKRLEVQRKVLGCTDPIKYIGLSATIAEPEKVFQMVTGRTPKVLSQSYAKVPERTTIAVYRKSKSDEFDVTVKLIEEGYSGFVFIDSRNGCEELAEQLNIHFDKDVAGYYHSNMNRGHQRSTSDKFRDGLLKVIVTTSSLEAGVNYPGACQFVVVDCGENIDPSSLAQRAGRAGRDGSSALLYCLVGKKVFNLDWFLDRGSTVVMPSTVPLIDTIHARRLATTLRDPKVALETFPLADADQVKRGGNPFFGTSAEQLFETDNVIGLIDEKGAKTIKRMGVSSAMANQPPGRVSDFYQGEGGYVRYEVLQLTGKGGILRKTTNHPNKVTPAITTTITDDSKILGSRGSITKDLVMTLGYGKLVDTCSQATFIETMRVRVCKTCKTHNKETAKSCTNCKGKSFTSYNKKGAKFGKTFAPVSYSYTAAFLIIRTEEIRSGTAYALARALASKVFVKEEDIGIAFQGEQVVFYDKHPHSNTVGYLFENWGELLAEAKGFIAGCRCNTGCVACCDVIKGQFVKASNKVTTLENITYLSSQKLVDLSDTLK